MPISPYSLLVASRLARSAFLLFQAIQSELLANRGAIETEPLGGDPTVALHALDNLFKQSRFHDTEHVRVKVDRRFGAALPDAVGQPAANGIAHRLLNVGNL